MRNDKKNYVMFVLFRNGQTYEESFKTKEEIERRVEHYIDFLKLTKCFNRVVEINLFEKEKKYQTIKGWAKLSL